MALVAASLVAGVVLSGCGLFIIDHEEAAKDFCQANVDNNVFKEARIDEEGRVFSEDQAIFWSDEYSKTMKYAEDSTRSLRSIARDLADAYDDVRDIADEDPEDIPEEELEEKYGELRQMRREVREACQPYLEQIEAEAAAREEDQ